MAIALATDIAFFYRRQLEKLMTLDAKTLLVLRQYEEPVRTRKEYEDDAISHWSQDKLNRSALVDIIRVKVLVGEVPTFAVRGKYGSGKSSLLNLLQLDLQGQAIVARFSTWLPGSENTLTNDLVQDIAKECRKHYHIPGIRRAAVRYARVFSTDVPYFKGLHELLTPPTQREEINAIKEILDSLPKRVVVLLDEIDRMRRKELLTLLKLIRGMDGIPNLTFVCAFDREKVEQIACKEFSEKSHEYFEKFFPNGIDLPDLDQDALKADFLESMLDPDLWSEDNDEI